MSCFQYVVHRNKILRFQLREQMKHLVICIFVLKCTVYISNTVQTNKLHQAHTSTVFALVDNAEVLEKFCTGRNREILNTWQRRNRVLCKQMTGKEQGDLEQVAVEEQGDLE